MKVNIEFRNKFTNKNVHFYMLNKRIENLLQLKSHLLENNEDWKLTKELAERQNAWFTQDFIEMSIHNICNDYLNEDMLVLFGAQLQTSEMKNKKWNIGITMAGNIPLVGFHDFLNVYLSGHHQTIKLSSKDEVLMTYILKYMNQIDEKNQTLFKISEMLKNCDVYIATGSNSSALYFEKYFKKFPHIIRKNRTSVAILTGDENQEELEKLADDVYLYFGLGCRNVTKVFVPRNYNFENLLHVFKKYDDLKHHNKYRNNFDYQLALYILNNQQYMSNESILLIENSNTFSAVSVLHYSYYDDEVVIENKEEIQALIGRDFIPFGAAQSPSLFDFADGVNTIEFLNSLE